jgi:hypothetical protein
LKDNSGSDITSSDEEKYGIDMPDVKRKKSVNHNKHVKHFMKEKERKPRSSST